MHTTLEKDCEACGTSFEAYRPNQRFCSRPCNRRLHNAKYRATVGQAYWRMYNYGISEDQYQLQLTIQDNQCPICEVALDGTYPATNSPTVDHCHQHEEGGIDSVRGILCKKCNTAIGMLGDNVAGLTRALDYLKNPPFHTQLKESP